MKIRYLVLAPIILSLSTLHFFAATYIVTNTNDSGPDSLREAVAMAKMTPDNDMIVFDISGCPDGVCTIVLTSGVLVAANYGFYSGSLTISNPAGPKKLIISGNHSSPILYAEFNAYLTIDGLTLKHANSSAPGSGAIALYACCNLVIANSEIVDNAGIGIGFGGGELLVVNSTVANNTGGGVSVAEGYTARFVNSTLSGNSSTGDGGAVRLIDSWADFLNVTVTNNSAAAGGGVGVTPGYSGSALRVRNSIITGNSAPVAPDVTTEFTRLIDLGNNIIGPPALLGPLANNGGPTRTHALLAASPAINAGNDCVLTENGCGDGNPALAADQRGVGRHGTVDIGAYEKAHFALSGTVTASSGGGIYQARIVLSDSDGPVMTAKANSFGKFTFPDVLSGVYTVSVRSKLYTFEPQAVELTNHRNDLHLVANGK